MAAALALPILTNALIPTGMTQHPDRIAPKRALPTHEQQAVAQPPWFRLRFVQYRGGAGAFSLAYTSNVTIGNGLIACFNWASLTATITNVTDTRGNSWERATGSYGGDASVGGGYSSEIWFCRSSVSSGANTVAPAFSSAPADCSIALLEWNGLNSNPFHLGAFGLVTTGTAASAGPFSTVAADELIVAFATPNVGATGAGPGFILRGIDAFSNLTEDRVAPSIGSYTATDVQISGASLMSAAVFYTWDPPATLPSGIDLTWHPDSFPPRRARAQTEAIYPAPPAAAFVQTTGLALFPDAVRRPNAWRLGSAEAVAPERAAPASDATFPDRAPRRFVRGQNDAAIYPAPIVVSFVQSAGLTSFPDQLARPVLRVRGDEESLPLDRPFPEIDPVLGDPFRRRSSALAWSATQTYLSPTAFLFQQLTGPEASRPRPRIPLSLDFAAGLVPAPALPPAVQADALPRRRALRPAESNVGGAPAEIRSLPEPVYPDRQRMRPSSNAFLGAPFQPAATVPFFEAPLAPPPRGRISVALRSAAFADATFAPLVVVTIIPSPLLNSETIFAMLSSFADDFSETTTTAQETDVSEAVVDPALTSQAMGGEESSTSPGKTDVSVALTFVDPSRAPT